VKEPATQKAMTTREFLSQDEETRRLYEERQRALRDYTSDMEGSKEDGRKEGRQEGMQQVARKMLDRGSAVEDVADITGISIAEIQKLQDETH